MTPGCLEDRGKLPTFSPRYWNTLTVVDIVIIRPVCKIHEGPRINCIVLLYVRRMVTQECTIWGLLLSHFSQLSISPRLLVRWTSIISSRLRATRQRSGSMRACPQLHSAIRFSSSSKYSISSFETHNRDGSIVLALTLARRQREWAKTSKAATHREDQLNAMDRRWKGLYEQTQANSRTHPEFRPLSIQQRVRLTVPPLRPIKTSEFFCTLQCVRMICAQMPFHARERTVEKSFRLVISCLQVIEMSETCSGLQVLRRQRILLVIDRRKQDFG